MKNLQLEKESFPYSVYDRLKEVVQLSYIDESGDWETDTSGLYYDPKINKFVLITCSGCSCWDGEYEQTFGNSLQEILNILIKQDEKNKPEYPSDYPTLSFTPTVFGRDYIFREASEKWDEIKDKYINKSQDSKKNN